MKVLIIEDNLDTVKGIIDELRDDGWEVQQCDFDKAEEAVNNFNPDMVVMDWMFDVEDTDEGLGIFNKLYENAFRPVIIFSAIADSISLQPEIIDNPLVDLIVKGDEQIIIERIKDWKPYIKAVKELRSDFNNSLLVSVNALDNFMKMPNYPGDGVVKYMLNKRTTYYFDKDYIGDCPPAWIQYEYPPVLDHLVVVDVLRIISEGTNFEIAGNPEEYYVVLTPSCDMARPNGGMTIIVAQCEAIERYCPTSKLKQTETIESKEGKKKKENLIKCLNQGYNSAKVALPELPNKIPYLCLNLKNIQQILLSEVAVAEKKILKEHKFFRVASINSPFREQIVWAHMINSCRPGMPERDMNTWAEGIMLK